MMAEEVKAKTTTTKAKVAEKVEAVVETPVVEKTPEPVVAEVKAKAESKVDAKPVVVPAVVPVVEESEETTEEPVEAMGKRGRRSKAEKISEFAHELGIKIHNEPHLEDLYRAEYAEKVAKLK